MIPVSQLTFSSAGAAAHSQKEEADARKTATGPRNGLLDPKCPRTQLSTPRVPSSQPPFKQPAPDLGQQDPGTPTVMHLQVLESPS
jgi:hypothetical protein